MTEPNPEQERDRVVTYDFTMLDVTRSADDVVRVGLHYPPHNLMHKALIREIAELTERLAADVGIRALILGSSIPGKFMAGADLNPGPDIWGELRERHALLMGALLRWEALPFPTIAEIGGHALGGGCEIVLACDFRLMARGRSLIGLPEIKHGMFPCGGGTTRVTRLVGRAKALDLVLRGRMIHADEAEAIGLISTACDEDELQKCTDELAAEFAALPPLALGAAKRVIRESLAGTLEDGLKNEGYEIWGLTTTEDVAEGLLAFKERRPPRFVGR